MSDQGFTFHATWERPCMGRFALHRPSQSSAVSTRCHAMTWRDLPGRVHLTVARVPTRNAHESRVALTTLRSEVRAGVYGSATGPQLAVSSLPGACLFQPGQEQPRARCEHAPVEPGFLCAAPAGTVHGSPSGSGHDVEVLGPDHVQGVGEASGGSLNPVLAAVSVTDLQAGDQGLRLLAGGRQPEWYERACAEAAGADRLPGASDPACWSSQRGQFHRDSDAALHSDDAASAGCGHRVGDHGERDMRPDLSPVMGTTSARQGLGCL